MATFHLFANDVKYKFEFHISSTTNTCVFGWVTTRNYSQFSLLPLNNLFIDICHGTRSRTKVKNSIGVLE